MSKFSPRNICTYPVEKIIDGYGRVRVQCGKPMKLQERTFQEMTIGQGGAMQKVPVLREGLFCEDGHAAGQFVAEIQRMNA